MTVAVSGVAAADAPRRGARYAGKTSQHRRVSGRVTSDGRTFQFHFDQIFTCNDGHRKITETKFLHQAPTIRADGTFSYHKRYTDLPGRQVNTEEQTVTGAFSDGGRHVRATVKETTSARSGLKCASTVTITASASA
jgi:hypothetical protein